MPTSLIFYHYFLLSVTIFFLSSIWTVSMLVLLAFLSGSGTLLVSSSLPSLCPHLHSTSTFPCNIFLTSLTICKPLTTPLTPLHTLLTPHTFSLTCNPHFPLCPPSYISYIHQGYHLTCPGPILGQNCLRCPISPQPKHGPKAGAGLLTGMLLLGCTGVG